MKILAIGDVVGSVGVKYLSEKLWRLRDSLGVDMVVANGENTAEIHGISASDARALLDAGVDVITLGNHTYGKRDICAFLSDDERIIRPANFPPTCPGGGYTTCRIDGYKVLCINVLGTALMEPLACPFDTVDRILERERGDFDIALLDIHAEATSEKMALARYFDGRISVMFGTHTHVPTADEQILPAGSGYITDIGMTGPRGGVIGADAAAVIERMRTKMPTRFTVADGEVKGDAALFEVDPDSGRTLSVRRISF